MATEKNLTHNGNAQRTVYVPVADIYETEDLYSLKLEIPGVPKENLDISIEENELTISAKSVLDDAAVEKCRYSEFSNMDYRRSFKIGNDIDSNKIEAKLENGVLTLTLHKHEKVKPRKISIKQIN
ncbi:MAG TPA: Hsp20/alpha crystallin family protein [Spirochaetota bacterium]|nr:Hsp20/alpha crystallin family protein [Spirochaetota bacterium]HPJ36305.1 Hsp20/alpha crystallin family protein [Spirochaetota bacterium]